MEAVQELRYGAPDDTDGADDWCGVEYVEPIIANTKTAVVTGMPRVYTGRWDNDGRAG